MMSVIMGTSVGAYPPAMFYRGLLSVVGSWPNISSFGCRAPFLITSSKGLPGGKFRTHRQIDRTPGGEFFDSRRYDIVLKNIWAIYENS